MGEGHQIPHAHSPGALLLSRWGCLSDGHDLSLLFTPCVHAQWLQWCLTLCDPMTEPARLFYAKDSPAKNMGVGCHDLLQGIFPTQRLSLNLHHWQADCLPLNHLGSKLVANCSASPRVPFQGFCVQNPSLQSQESVRFSGVFLQPINIAPMLAFIITLLLYSIPYATAGDSSLIPGSGRSPGEGSGKPLQYSCLGNPMDRGAWWAYSPWSHENHTRLSD